MQDRARTDDGPVRDADVREHARAGPHHAAVSEPRMAMKRGGRMHVVERSHMDVVGDDATFVEDVEVADDDVAGEHDPLMNHVTLAERDEFAVDLHGRVDQVRK